MSGTGWRVLTISFFYGTHASNLQGRSVWTEIIKNARSTSRLIHIHVPARLTPKTEEEIRTGEVRRSTGELVKATGEKRLALDLIAGFCYALKHHIRYDLIPFLLAKRN